MKARGGGQLDGYTYNKDEEFLQIYQAHKKTVFGIAFNYTKNQADANDIVQEVFMKYYTNQKIFNGEDHIKAWLIRVSVNASKKHLISAWMRKTVPLDETIPFEHKEDSGLFEVVMALPKNYRLVVHLYYYEGYSISEIASILGAKEGTIKVRLMRARDMLKLRLKEVWLDEE